MFDIEKFGTKAAESDQSKIFDYTDAKDNVENVNGSLNDDLKESLINSLDLNETEKGVLDNIDFSGGEAVKNASGEAEVYGDCPSTTCTYTETYYSCPSTGE